MDYIPEAFARPPAAPLWLKGLWRRQEINFPDGATDRTTLVLWGQTSRLYVDLRIPADRPAARGRQGFDEFSLDELADLAEQKGFAGHILMDGNICSWVRYIDYRPDTGRPDRGSLRLKGDTLYEEGDPTSVLASAYREIYHRESEAARRSVALRRLPVNQRMAGGAPGGGAVLLLIDDCFLFARDRPTAPPPAQTLRELVLAAGDDRATIAGYLDCEISFGTREASGRWKILSSTIPFREGQALFQLSSVEGPDETGVLTLRDERRIASWQVVESTMPPGELAALLAHGIGPRS